MAVADDSTKFYVYVHIRKKDGTVFYVGKGHGRRAYTTKSRNPHWRNIVRKDGGFEVKIISSNLTESSAFKLETETIRKYKNDGAKLCNLTDGGDGVSGYKFTKPPHNKGVPCSEEVKRRLSEAHKASGHLPPIGWNKGQKTPMEVLEKRSLAMKLHWAKGLRNPVSEETRLKQSLAKKGRKLPDETRLKMSISGKKAKYVRVRPDMTGFKHSEESKKKMSLAKIGQKPNNARAVICLTTGQIFESATSAAASLGKKTHSLIAACCRGKSKTAYGMRFEYSDGLS